MCAQAHPGPASVHAVRHMGSSSTRMGCNWTRADAPYGSLSMRTRPPARLDRSNVPRVVLPPSPAPGRNTVRRAVERAGVGQSHTIRMVVVRPLGAAAARLGPQNAAWIHAAFEHLVARMMALSFASFESCLPSITTVFDLMWFWAICARAPARAPAEAAARPEAPKAKQTHNRTSSRLFFFPFSHHIVRSVYLSGSRLSPPRLRPYIPPTGGGVRAASSILTLQSLCVVPFSFLSLDPDPDPRPFRRLVHWNESTNLRKPIHASIHNTCMHSAPNPAQPSRLASLMPS